MVAPYAGAWIERFNKEYGLKLEELVAPYAGAWIERLLMLNN